MRPDSGPRKPYPAFGTGRGCDSCTMSLPEETFKKLPAGAPGSPRANGIGRNGSPILRSKESLQIYGNQQTDSDTDEDPIPLQPSPESLASDTSASYYHKHTLTYLSTSSPPDPSTYSIVRQAAIQTLSREQLPLKQTAGEVFFGDPINGWVIAYKFRLPDPHARGGHRKYALLALTSRESRATQATAFVWARFQQIAAGMMARTEQVIEQNNRGFESREEISKSEYALPVHSFLTGRMMDPDGYPRHGGGARMRARGLTEMVGDENFFAQLHLDFIGMLRDLRYRYGG